MIKIKICGMTDPDNAGEILALKPDYLGFIFYEKSKRAVNRQQALWIRDVTGVQKTGVFVNAVAAEIAATADQLSLHAVQLHGDESPAFCLSLKNTGLQVIKAFGIHEKFNWNALDDYAGSVDYFLFDTQSATYGGSGRTFNWDLLEKHYRLSIPYFLSGGLNPENISRALAVSDERLYALDLNSGFELNPGIKDRRLLEGALALNI